MGITADTIAVEITGRIDKLEAVMRRSESVVGTTANKLDRRLNAVGENMGGNFMKNVGGYADSTINAVSFERPPVNSSWNNRLSWSSA